MKNNAKIQKLTIYFKSSFYKEVEVEIERDVYGDYSVTELRCMPYFNMKKSIYTSSDIRTERRESKILQYVNQYVNIEERFADDKAGF